MSSFDGAYENLVHGVSQQVATARLSGQVSEQINMVSDLVTGVRRRPGLSQRFTLYSEGASNNFKAWRTDIGGVSCECYLNGNTGELIIMEEGNAKEVIRFTNPYLRTTNIATIQHTGVGDSLFILNTLQVPTGFKGGESTKYRTGGFINVKGAALSQKFDVEVSDGDKRYSGYFTTPDGRDASHAQYVTTSYIANRLARSLQGENMIFPEGGKKNPVQDSPISQENHNPLDGGLKVIKQGNSAISIRIMRPHALKADMPEGYISIEGESESAIVNRETTVTILRAEPSTTYRIYYKGKPWTYTTPDGSIPDHAQYLTLTYIRDSLYSSMEGYDMVLPPVRWELEEGKPPGPPIIHTDPNNDFDQHFEIYVSGAQVYVQSKHGKAVRIVSGSGSVYIDTSEGGVLNTVTKLPSTLPQMADGLVLGVGHPGAALTYFKYESGDTRWVESAKPGGVAGINKMPIEIYWDGDSWRLEDGPFDGTKAGDDKSNPPPEFIDWGITGISSYQGRLVIMSGSWVYLSETNAPRNFFRTTVDTLLDSDPIGVGSSSASSASFRYGVVFNKDLLLFSPEHQALIPGMNQGITPKNAHILITSTYTADMGTSPVTLGSSVMYTLPRSKKHFGVLEMIPSHYTDSMYTSVDASEHIPSYMNGRCRFSVASSVGSMVVFGSTEATNTLYVHEYMWDGEDKVLKAWHRWEFATDIAYAFFTGALINIITVDSKTGTVVVNTLDPKATTKDTYLLDYHISLPVKEVNGAKLAEIPQGYRNFLEGQGILDKLEVVYEGGYLDSTQIGGTYLKDRGQLELNPSTTAKRVVVGIPYSSVLEPSPPVIRDHKDRPMVFNRVQLVKMYCRTNSSGVFEVEVMDHERRGDIQYDVNPTRWLSTDLNLGKSPIGGLEGSIIPCRVDANSGVVKFKSNGVSEMNIINLEYTCKASQRRARR